MKSTYTQSRNQALDLASKRALISYRTPLSSDGKPARISEYYGESTLSLDKLKTTLGENDYQHILDAVYSGSKMNRNVVEKVAVTVKDWAVSKGATHFTH